MEIFDEYPLETSAEKRVALVKDAFKIHTENLWIIGIVERPLQQIFYVAKNDLRNAPKGPIANAALEHHSGLYFFKR